MRDLKRKHSALFWTFRSTDIFYLTKASLPYELTTERFTCYDGHTTRSVIFKESMAGYPMRAYIRTKIAGRSIHLRSKKKKGK